MQVTPRPKPEKRKRDPDLLRNFAIRMSNCCVCGEGRHSGLQAHHILRRSQSGDDCSANLCALCAACHRALHDGDSETQRRLGEHICRMRPDTLDYLAHCLGATQSVSYMERSYGGGRPL